MKQIAAILLLASSLFADDLTSTEQPAPTPEPAPVATSAPVPSSTASSEKLYSLGVGALYWMAGEVSIDAYRDFDADKDPGFVLKLFADYFVAPRFVVGTFVLMGSSKVDDVDFSFTEIGMSLKPVIKASPTVTIQPGLFLGYRMADLDGDDDYQGLGVNFGTEIIFGEGSVKPYADFGFLSQPVGGNGDIGVAWAPIWYIGGGVAF